MSYLTPREADPPSAQVCSAVFAQFFLGKIGLRLQSRRAAYAIVGCLNARGGHKKYDVKNFILERKRWYIM